MHKLGSKIDLYIGHLVDHESDQLALMQVVEAISKDSIQAVIMANVHLSGRQIDLIVATESQLLVIEAKKSSRPLRGSENGVWEFLSATGEWRTIGKNYYIQTLEAKNALHSSMSKFSGRTESYPDAALIFVTGIPNGSKIPPSDFKVKIDGLKLLENYKYKDDSRSLWSLDTWYTFAKKNNLIKVDTLDSALHENLLQASLLLDEYRKSYSDLYTNQSQNFVPIQGKTDGVPVSSIEIEHLMPLEKGLMIVGSSGCGKSMLSQRIGLTFVQGGGISVFIEAKNFENELNPLLSQEAALLVPTSSIKNIMSACRIFDTPLLIILDGYNECPQSYRQRLARCLRAFSIRYRANIVVTSQDMFPELMALNFKAFHVDEPNAEIKKAIAGIEVDEPISSKEEYLLALAKSGLEAKIVGQISKTIQPGISRYALFDAYIRKRLENSAQEAIRMLAHIGKYLSENLCFSMSIRDFDRLSDVFSWQTPILKQLLEANVLSRRGDRISFGHELYLNAFSAEAVIRACNNDAGKVALEIKVPKYSNYKVLIIGAIDNCNLLDAVLEKIDDFEIIISCAIGECGDYAQSWADNRCKEILKKVETEARSVIFNINEDSWMGASAEENTLTKWSVQEKIFIDVISSLMGKGKYLNEVFHIAGVMDEQLQKAFNALIEVARQKKSRYAVLFLELALPIKILTFQSAELLQEQV